MRYRKTIIKTKTKIKIKTNRIKINIAKN